MVNYCNEKKSNLYLLIAIFDGYMYAEINIDHECFLNKKVHMKTLRN